MIIAERGFNRLYGDCIVAEGDFFESNLTLSVDRFHVSLVTAIAGMGKSARVMQWYFNNKDRIDFTHRLFIQFTELNDENEESIAEKLRDLVGLYSNSDWFNASTNDKYILIQEQIKRLEQIRSPKLLIIADNIEDIPSGLLKKLFELPNTTLIYTYRFSKDSFVNDFDFTRVDTQINAVPLPNISNDVWISIAKSKLGEGSSLNKFQEDDLIDVLLEIKERFNNNIFAMERVLAIIQSDGISAKDTVLKSIASLSLTDDAALTKRLISATYEKLTDELKAVLALYATMYDGCDSNTIATILDKPAHIVRNSNRRLQGYYTGAIKESEFYIFWYFKQFIISAISSDYQQLGLADQLYQNLVEYFIQSAEEIGFCYNQPHKMQALDAPERFLPYKIVLDWCYKNGRYNDYIRIAKNLRYFFYSRSIWDAGSKNIYLRWAECARKSDDVSEEFEALVYFVNVTAKYELAIPIEAQLKRLSELLCYDNIGGDGKFRYYHALALYYNFKGNMPLVSKNIEIAFNEYAEYANYHDLQAAKKWSIKYRRKTAKENGDKLKILDEMKTCLMEAMSDCFPRAIVDCVLTITDIYLELGDVAMAREVLCNNALGLTTEIEQIIAEVNTPIYSSEFYFLRSCVGDDLQAEKDFRRALQICDQHGLPHRKIKIQEKRNRYKLKE